MKTITLVVVIGINHFRVTPENADEQFTLTWVKEPQRLKGVTASVVTEQFRKELPRSLRAFGPIYYNIQMDGQTQLAGASEIKFDEQLSSWTKHEHGNVLPLGCIRSFLCTFDN